MRAQRDWAKSRALAKTDVWRSTHRAHAARGPGPAVYGPVLPGTVWNSSSRYFSFVLGILDTGLLPSPSLPPSLLPSYYPPITLPIICERRFSLFSAGELAGPCRSGTYPREGRPLQPADIKNKYAIPNSTHPDTWTVPIPAIGSPCKDQLAIPVPPAEETMHARFLRTRISRDGLVSSPWSPGVAPTTPLRRWVLPVPDASFLLTRRTGRQFVPWHLGVH